MKVGIIAMHAKHSFDSALQIFFLQRFIEREGHTAEVVDYRPAIVDSANRSFKDNYERRAGYYERFLQKFLPMSERAVNKADTEQFAGKYDLLIAAGPGIFDGSVTRGLKPVYFLCFDKEVPKAACGISILKDEAASFETEFCCKYLSGFQYLSATDVKIAERLQAYTKLPVEATGNLLLLGEKEDYEALCEQADPKGFAGISYRSFLRKSKRKSPYIMMYARGRVKNIIRVTKRLRGLTKLPVLHNAPATKLWNQICSYSECSPEQVPVMIAGAEYVVTDSPDVMLLAMMYQKKMIPLTSGAATERMIALAQEYGLEAHLIDRRDMLTQPEQAEIDYSAISVQLQEKREALKAGLRRMLREAEKRAVDKAAADA